MNQRKDKVKPKLPRRRKKACIKEDGRRHYHDTVFLAKATGESPCKFWKLSSVENEISIVGNHIIYIPTPKAFW